MATSTKPRGGRSGESANIGGATTAAARSPASVRAANANAQANKPAAARTPASTRDPSKPLRRRDATGHLDPSYAADLLAHRRGRRSSDDDHAFLSGAFSSDPLAEQLGEDFVTSALSGRGLGDDLLDEEVPEDTGGPFVETSARIEVAHGADASNPKSAEVEPFPTT